MVDFSWFVTKKFMFWSFNDHLGFGIVMYKMNMFDLGWYILRYYVPDVYRIRFVIDLVGRRII